MRKTKIVMTKHVYLGSTLLDRKKAKLCYINTDHFTIQIKTKYISKNVEKKTLQITSIYFVEDKTESILFFTKNRKRQIGTLDIQYGDVKINQ